MMSQQYQGRKWKGTKEERRELMLEVAHMLNRLRSTAEEAEQPLTPREEEAFWAFIGTLPLNDQSSVIN